MTTKRKSSTKRPAKTQSAPVKKSPTASMTPETSALPNRPMTFIAGSILMALVIFCVGVMAHVANAWVTQ